MRRSYGGRLHQWVQCSPHKEKMKPAAPKGRDETTRGSDCLRRARGDQLDRCLVWVWGTRFEQDMIRTGRAKRVTEEALGKEYVRCPKIVSGKILTWWLDLS